MTIRQLQELRAEEQYLYSQMKERVEDYNRCFAEAKDHIQALERQYNKVAVLVEEFRYDKLTISFDSADDKLVRMSR
ncbi:hypothetical protein LCGC14_2893690 [marine sediment metagenome]|uniref:Uncharacterized protein n=1 Tax=marine sediment metagenome TaxID=412755 RepID=A0A0F8XWV5_9ZZZZ